MNMRSKMQSIKQEDLDKISRRNSIKAPVGRPKLDDMGEKENEELKESEVKKTGPQQGKGLV